MLKEIKKKFYDKINEIEIYLSANTECENQEDYFLSVKKELDSIQSQVVILFENLKIDYDILLNNFQCEGDSLKGQRNIIELASMLFTKLNLFIFLEMPEKLILFNIANGKFFYEKGDIGAALDSWEEVLKIDPANKFVHDKLDCLLKL